MVHTQYALLSNERGLCVQTRALTAGYRIWTLKDRKAKLRGRNGVSAMLCLYWREGRVPWVPALAWEG